MPLTGGYSWPSQKSLSSQPDLGLKSGNTILRYVRISISLKEECWSTSRFKDRGINRELRKPSYKCSYGKASGTLVLIQFFGFISETWTCDPMWSEYFPTMLHSCHRTTLVSKYHNNSGYEIFKLWQFFSSRVREKL